MAQNNQQPRQQESPRQQQLEAPPAAPKRPELPALKQVRFTEPTRVGAKSWQPWNASDTPGIVGHAHPLGVLFSDVSGRPLRLVFAPRIEVVEFADEAKA